MKLLFFIYGYVIIYDIIVLYVWLCTKFYYSSILFYKHVMIICKSTRIFSVPHGRI